MSEALLLDGVHKSFGQLEVLRGIDLHVAEHDGGAAARAVADVEAATRE